MGNILQRPSETREDRVLSADNDSVSCMLSRDGFTFAQADCVPAYNPPSASTPDPGESSGDVVEAPLNRFQFAHPPAATKVNQPASAILFLREQVKDALRSLGSHNIEYDDLVGEGVDPQLLRKLYEDIKQEITQSTLPSSDMIAHRVSAPQKAVQQDPQQSNDLIGQLSYDPGQTMPAANTLEPNSIVMSDHSASKSMEGESLSDVSKAPTPVEVRTEKPSVVLPPSNTAMERKDHIGRGES